MNINNAVQLFVLRSRRPCIECDIQHENHIVPDTLQEWPNFLAHKHSDLVARLAEDPSEERPPSQLSILRLLGVGENFLEMLERLWLWGVFFGVALP